MRSKKTQEREKYVTTFSSEVGFTYQLRIASDDLSLQIECIGHQNETKVHLSDELWKFQLYICDET